MTTSTHKQRVDPMFGERLQAARKRAGYRTQQALGDVIGVSGRTIRNWETDKTHPDANDLAALRRAVGTFDVAGDPVEVAMRESRLTEDRQYVVLAAYKRELRQQDEESQEREPH